MAQHAMHVIALLKAARNARTQFSVQNVQRDILWSKIQMTMVLFHMGNVLSAMKIV
jgi:hypothetical protein